MSRERTWHLLAAFGHRVGHRLAIVFALLFLLGLVAQLIGGGH